MASNDLSWAGISLRLLFALALVLLTYNPTEYSFIDWVINPNETPLVYKVISGILLLIGWAIYIRATLNSLGVIGIGLAAALFGCVVWLFIEWGLFSATNVSAMAWAIEIIMAIILTLGMCWAHIRRILSGQVTTDEAE